MLHAEIINRPYAICSLHLKPAIYKALDCSIGHKKRLVFSIVTNMLHSEDPTLSIIVFPSDPNTLSALGQLKPSLKMLVAGDLTLFWVDDSPSFFWAVAAQLVGYPQVLC